MNNPLAIVCGIFLTQPMVTAQENLPSPKSDKCTSHPVAEHQGEDFGRKTTAEEKETLQKRSAGRNYTRHCLYGRG